MWVFAYHVATLLLCTVALWYNAYKRRAAVCVIMVLCVVVSAGAITFDAYDFGRNHPPTPIKECGHFDNKSDVGVFWDTLNNVKRKWKT